MSDSVNHPAHYHSEYWHSKCGKTVECIDIVRHMDFNLGNAVKYIWRAGKKGDEVQDLEKAIWYLQDRVSELKKAQEALEAADEVRKDAAEDEIDYRQPPRWGEEQIGRVLSAQESNQPTYVTRMPKAVTGGPGEFWVLRADNATCANSAWHTFNTSSLFLDHRARLIIRQELLGLISKLPPEEFDKLNSQVQEAVTDWLIVEEARRDR